MSDAIPEIVCSCPDCLCTRSTGIPGWPCQDCQLGNHIPNTTEERNPVTVVSELLAEIKALKAENERLLEDVKDLNELLDHSGRAVINNCGEDYEIEGRTGFVTVWREKDDCCLDSDGSGAWIGPIGAVAPAFETWLEAYRALLASFPDPCPKCGEGLNHG